MESLPEKQREFQRLFKQYKERAKEIIRRYKESEITRKNASDELSKMNDRIFKFIREDN